MDLTNSPLPVSWLFAVTQTLRGLLGAVHRLGKLGSAETLLVHARLGQIALRMDRLAVRFRAGTLVTRGPRSVVAANLASTGAAEAAQPAKRRSPAVRWPRRQAWLVEMAGYPAAGMGSQFRAMLRTPEMVELLLAGPQAARILRPMCRMLGVEASLLDPTLPLPVFVPKVVREKAVRVRRKRPPIDWGRVPLPRGTLAYARRLGFKPVR